jgi:hypothetical protein
MIGIDRFLVLTLLASFLAPFVSLLRLSYDSRSWKHDLLRALYGDISGLIIFAAFVKGYSGLAINPSDLRLSSYLSLLFLIPVVLDVYKSGSEKNQLRSLLFYPALGFSVILNLLFVLLQVYWRLI